jgi:hypothetical protein
MSTLRRYKKKHKRSGKYKSPLEQKIAKLLGRKARYETEKLEYYLPKKYIPDFVIPNKDGTLTYIEVKGYLRYEDQVKMRAVRLQHPEKDIWMWFPKDQRVHRSNLTNSEWCDKYGYKWRIVDV